jgi:hypothetical protein
MEALPSKDRSEILNSISTYKLCHTFATDDYDQQWIGYLANECLAFDDWKAGASECYLHCSGRPRCGKVGAPGPWTVNTSWLTNRCLIFRQHAWQLLLGTLGTTDGFHHQKTLLS